MPIIGIGTDIVDIERIEKAIASNNGSFLKRYFTEAENQFFAGLKISAQTAAANFAAKEAYVKALGTGFSGISPPEIEVLRDGNGKPYINAYGAAKQAAESLGVKSTHVSLSHSGGCALAFVVLED